MAEEQKSKLFFLGIFPRCPFYKPVPVLIILALIALGTVGIYYLNLWAAVGYLIYANVWYFLAMPLQHCKYCYFAVTETTVDNGKSIEKLLPKDQWTESYLPKHVAWGQKITVFLTLVWFVPPVLIIISFFLNYSIVAVISLIGFIAVLAGNLVYMARKVCTKCAVKEECHAAFGKKKERN